MVELVSRNNGEIKTTSKVVADAFGKPHRDVTKAIQSLDCSEEFRARNFSQSSYTSPQNKILKCVDITRDGFSFLCMGFSGKKAAVWKEAYIKAFNDMEKGLLNVDARINNLSIEGDQIKISGKKWSDLGHEIRRQKKDHSEKVDVLMSEVQMKIEFSDER